jgi:hypothetical protein
LFGTGDFLYVLSQRKITDCLATEHICNLFHAGNIYRLFDTDNIYKIFGAGDIYSVWHRLNLQTFDTGDKSRLFKTGKVYTLFDTEILAESLKVYLKSVC